MVYAFYGPRVAGVLAFALGYLLFAVPFGYFLVPPLETVTAELAAHALELAGVSVAMQGHAVATPTAVRYVVESCSGIKLFVASVAFGVLYAYWFYTSQRRRLIFIASALVVPVIANAMGVYFTLLVGSYFDLEYAGGGEHPFSGWLFFGVVLIVLFICGWPGRQPPTVGPAPEVGLAAGKGSARMRWMVPVVLALIVMPASWYAVTGLLAAGHDNPGPSTLPPRLAGHTVVNRDYNGDSTPPGHGLDVHLSHRYGHAARPVRVDYLGIDAGSNGPDLLDIRAALYDPSVWHVTAGPTVVHADPHGPDFKVLTLQSSRGAGTRKLLYAYRIGPRWVTSPIRFKLWQARDRLLGRPAPAGLLMISEAGRPSSAQLAGVGAAAVHVLRSSAP